MSDVELHPVSAMLAGLYAGVITLVIMMVLLGVAPRRFPANLLYILGSAFSIETTVAYVSGFVVFAVVSVAFGLFTSALLVGFEVNGYHYLWGMLVGLTLSVISGTSLAYSRNLNSAVRRGFLGDPGPYLVAYGRTTVLQFVIGHMLFGSLAGQLYSVLT